ncbi:MAG: ABC transporter permease [Candidatus Acidiferrales bacterium]
MGNLLNDLKYSIRMLGKAPGFTAIAVLTLAMGIGANTAIFTLVDAVLLRPLPYRAPQQLVWINEQTSAGDSTGVSWPNFQDWNRMNNVFSGMAGYRDANLPLAGDTYPELISGRYVTANYFDLMGIKPLLGRTFEPAENNVGGPDVAILSYEFWQQRYGGSPQVLGKTLRLNFKSFTIIGVMPSGYGAVSHTAVWAPFEQNVPKEYLAGRGIAWLLYVVGRAKPGVSLEQARSDLQRVGEILAREYPGIDTESYPVLKDLHREMLGDNRAILLLLAAAVALLLLITCANLAGLLLVKMGARQREFSVRLALGASRGNILQQVFAEGVLLALAGGVLGVLGAWSVLGVASALLPKNVPLAGPLALGWHVLAFAFGLTLLSCLLSGLAPARLTTRADLQSVLRTSSRQVHGGHRRVHSALIVCEIGLAMAVLVGTGLLVRTMIALFHTDVGFDPKHLLTATVTLPRADYPSNVQRTSFMQEGIDRISKLPGVESAAAVFPVPFTPQIYQSWLAVEGRVPRMGAEQVTYVFSVSYTYLQTMRIPVVQGRGFAVEDTSEKIRSVVIDQELASKYWPGQNPVGRFLKLSTQDFADPQQQPWTVIGVAGSVRAASLDAESSGRVYVLLNQLPTTNISFVARTKTDPRGLASGFENEIHSLNGGLPVFNIVAIEDLVWSSQQPRRVAMILLISFSIAALILTAMGLYGIIAYLVELRTNEIGIRMALGALPRDIMKLVLGYGATLAVGGVAVGLLATFALTQLMRTLLYGVAVTDPLTFAIVAAVILAIALMACYVPARRAMRVDPMIALRYE